MKQRAPDPRTARTRAAVLAAAAELLEATGTERTSVAQIAARAGVSVGSVYLHFKSKEQLIAQVILLAWERASDEFAAVRESRSPLERVAGFGEAYLAFAQREPVAFRTLTVWAMEPAPDSGLDTADLLGPHRDQLAADLAEAMQLGELTEGSPAAATAYLFGAWSGIAGQFVRRDGLAVGGDVAIDVRALLSGVLSGLRPAALSA